MFTEDDELNKFFNRSGIITEAIFSVGMHSEYKFYTFAQLFFFIRVLHKN